MTNVGLVETSHNMNDARGRADTAIARIVRAESLVLLRLPVDQGGVFLKAVINGSAL